MPATPPRPSIYNLQRFLLGTLPPAEAAVVAAWVESSPDAARALAGVAAHDALTKAVASTAGVKPPPAPLVARVVETVTGSHTPAADSTPDVNEQTRPSAAPWPGAPGAVPERIGPFAIDCELGRGGMGVVYAAEDTTLNRPVALKVLAPDLATNPEARERFLREGRAAAALKSPHIVTVHHADVADGVPFLVMEFIEGVTLETWRKTRSAPVAVEDVVWAAEGLLAGLAVAHAKGVIHRDMKPTNVMVERATGVVKILDFGLTRGADGAEQLTSVGSVLGTPAYMSPEQANGRSVDVRSDLFSVGAMLHALVTGRSPFARDSVMATLFAVVNEAPLPADLPVPLREFVARLLSKDPTDRPADAGAALTELRAIVARPPASRPKPPPLPPSVSKPTLQLAGAVEPLDLPEPAEPVRSHRTRNLVLLAAALLLAATAVFKWPKGDSSSSDPEIVEQEAKLIELKRQLAEAERELNALKAK